MPLDKEDIRQRTRVLNVWITSHLRAAPTEFFTANVPEGDIRYITRIEFSGDLNQTQLIEIFKSLEDGVTYETKFLINIAAADRRQIPEGAYDIENPVISLSGGENLAASVLIAGTSLATSITFWDGEI